MRFDVDVPFCEKIRGRRSSSEALCNGVLSQHSYRSYHFIIVFLCCPRPFIGVWSAEGLHRALCWAQFAFCARLGTRLAPGPLLGRTSRCTIFGTRIYFHILDSTCGHNCVLPAPAKGRHIFITSGGLRVQEPCELFARFTFWHTKAHEGTNHRHPNKKTCPGWPPQVGTNSPTTRICLW